MLAERENKILGNILSGKMRRVHIYSMILVAVVFLIVLFVSFNAKSKILITFEKMFGQSTSALTKIETTTKLEDSLKYMLIKNDGELHKMANTLIAISINWWLFWLGTLFFMTAINFWNFIILERIIKKLQEIIREVT